MNRNEENNNTSSISQSNNTKPMDSKKEVEKSPDAKTDQDFPGYPHYPAKDDMMDQRTGSHRVDANLEQMSAGPNASGVNQRFLAGQEQNQQSPANDSGAEGESNELAAMNSREDEIGTPQNVNTEDLNSGEMRSNSDAANQ